jgi:hypothetical protein
MNESDAAVDDGGRRRMLRARWALAAFAVGTALCLVVAVTPDPNPPFVPPPGATRDLDVFHRVVTRVGLGESFYDVTQQEFRSHGYPTRSVFNWRTPVYAWWLGRVTGEGLGRMMLMAGALLAVVLGCRDLLTDRGLTCGSIGGIALVGAMAWCTGGETFLFTELWAAMLIVLSLCALRRGWVAWGVVLGILAVFFRELALPYALAALALAAWEGRRREAVGWVLGLAVLAACMAWHASVVGARITGEDQALAGGWVRFGGLRFVLATARTNVFLMSFPLWATALFLPAACLGLAGMRDESGRRVALTIALYLAAFAVVGNPFNFYWGFITAPLLAMGLAHAPGAARELLDAAFPRRLVIGIVVPSRPSYSAEPARLDSLRVPAGFAPPDSAR